MMDGGTCEATAFNCFGFRVAGISTPLVNYHNSPKKPLPEAVSCRDVEQLTELLTHLMRKHSPADARKLVARSFGPYLAKLRANQNAHRRYFKGI